MAYDEIMEVAELVKKILNVSDLTCYSPTVISSFKALIAAAELLEGVVVLEEGSEPEVGDYVLLPDVLGYTVIDEVSDIAKNGNVKTVSYSRYHGHYSKYKIIQRNNRPVITIPKDKQ